MGIHHPFLRKAQRCVRPIDQLGACDLDAVHLDVETPFEVCLCLVEDTGQITERQVFQYFARDETTGDVVNEAALARRDSIGAGYWR